MKRVKYAKNLIDSLIPMGLIVGCAIGAIVGVFLKPNLLVFTISVGSGVGYLFGIIAYVIYGKRGHHS